MMVQWFTRKEQICSWLNVGGRLDRAQFGKKKKKNAHCILSKHLADKNSVECIQEAIGCKICIQFCRLAIAALVKKTNKKNPTSSLWDVYPVWKAYSHKLYNLSYIQLIKFHFPQLAFKKDRVIFHLNAYITWKLTW